MKVQKLKGVMPCVLPVAIFLIRGFPKLELSLKIFNDPPEGIKPLLICNLLYMSKIMQSTSQVTSSVSFTFYLFWPLLGFCFHFCARGL